MLRRLRPTDSVRLAHDRGIVTVHLCVRSVYVRSNLDAYRVTLVGSASAILYNFTHSRPGATSVFTGQYQKWIVIYFSCTMFVNILCSGG